MFQFPYQPGWWLLPAGALVGGAFSAGAGWWSLRSVVSTPPMTTLRSVSRRQGVERCINRPALQAMRLSPHQRAMNTASTAVVCIMLSIETHSSMPWMLEPVGP